MSSLDYNTLFQDFLGREEDLKKITRYSTYATMFYRTNVWTHSRRTAWIVREIIPYAQKVWPAFDGVKTEIMALIHDDQEIIMGDIQAGDKSKMTAEQLKEVSEIEERAIEMIADRFPERIGSYSYRELLRESAAMKTREAQVMKYADKMDGFGEALHEVYGGNGVFEINTVNQYGVIPTATTYYLNYFPTFSKSYPEIIDSLKNYISIFVLPLPAPFKDIVATRRPHSAESLQEKTGHAHYDFWRGTVLKYADTEELKELYIQKEFLPI